MPATLFKRLFEVRFLHEYYLSDREQGGVLFFSKSAAQQDIYLKKQIENGRYNILNDLDFEPTPETTRVLRGRRLKFARNATGFFLGGEVTGETDTNGMLRYKMVRPLESGLTFSFFLKSRNPQFRSFTALRLRPAGLPAFYFFTNTGKTAGTSPKVSLAESVSAFIPGNIYEPGEVALINGSLKEAIAITQSQAPESWGTVDGTGYVNENDRLVLGKQFRWPWQAEPQTVQFTLIDEALTGNDARIKTIQVVVTERNRSVSLDYSRKHPAAGQRLGDPIPDGFYLIEAKGNFDTFNRRVYLHGELSAGNPSNASPGIAASPAGLLGIVQITVTNDPAEGVPFTDTGGYVQQLALPDGTLSHTIYEVRWLSRSAWWRYRSDRGKSLKALGVAASHLDQQGNDLVSTKPLRFFAGQTELSAGVNLPNPRPEQLKPEPNGRYYADIWISKVANLIDVI